MSQHDPMAHLDDWEESLAARYPAAGAPTVLADSAKPATEFRNYAADVRPTVREFYRLNHRHQTLDFVLDKKRQYLPLRTRRMGIWEAMEFLNTLVDDSDPDTDLSQIEHLMQTAEAIRREYELTRAQVLSIKGCGGLLDSEPTLQRSIRLRNPYVDPIHLTQVDLLRRWRAAGRPARGDRDLLDALVASVNGISQGLQGSD